MFWLVLFISIVDLFKIFFSSLCWMISWYLFFFCFFGIFISCILVSWNHQDDEGDNSFHIAADAAKMIRENLEWLIIMLRNPDAAVEVRNHRHAPVITILKDFHHLYLFKIFCSESAFISLKILHFCLLHIDHEVRRWSKMFLYNFLSTSWWQR